MLQSQVSLAISDRPCEALSFAEDIGIPSVVIREPSSRALSEAMLKCLKSSEIDFGVFFFTRLVGEPLIEEYSDRLLNFHPTLLPKYPGLGGLEASIRSQDSVVGATVHVIDGTVDAGPICLQAAVRRNPDWSYSMTASVIRNIQVQQLQMTAELISNGSFPS